MANGTWRIARGRGNAQLPLAIVAVLAVIVLLAGKANLIPFERMRASLTDWSAPALQAINAPVAAASHWFSGIGHFFDVYSENIRLRQENARLRQWQGAALMLEGRMTRYQRLLKAVPDPSLSAVTARVIGHASHPFLETLIIGAGKRNGIKAGQAVVDARGMLGRIYLAGDHTAWVVLLTDLNSRIAVSIQPKDVQAILAGDNTDAPDIEALAQGVKLKEGQEVVTSGDGGLLPPGLPIGVLVRAQDGFRVALFADPVSADEVRVLDFKNPIERLPAPAPSDLPAAVAGFKPSPPPTSAEPEGAASAGQNSAVGGPKPAPHGIAASPKTTTPAASSVPPNAPKTPAEPPDPSGD